MTVENQIRDIATYAVVGIHKGIGAPTLPPGGHRAVHGTTLTCTWVTADDGALVMHWTGQTPEYQPEEMVKAAA